MNWLRESEEQEEALANGSALGRALGFWEEVYSQALKGGIPEDTPAAQHLRMEKISLGLWRERDAFLAVRDLYAAQRRPARADRAIVE